MGPTQCIYSNSKAGSGTGSMPGRCADGSLAVHPVTSENTPGRPWVVGPRELEQNQTIYVLIDTGAELDSSDNSPASLADSDSNFAVAEQVVVPKGTVTFRVGEVSTTTTIVISFIVSVPLAGKTAYLIGPGDPQSGLNLITVVLMDGAWIFIFSVMFQLAFNTCALPLSPTGHVALASAASLTVVALHSEEPLEDLLIPHIGSPIGVHSDFVLCFTEGVVASTEWSKMIRIIARSVGSATPLAQRDSAHVLAPGSIGSGNPPTSLTYGSEVAVVVDEGTLLDLAGNETGLRFRPCLPRCACSCTTSAVNNAEVDTDRKGSNNIWLALEGLRVRSGGVCGYVWGIENSEKTEVGVCRRALDLGRDTRANSVPRGDQRMRAPDERKRSTIMGRQNLFNFLAKDANNT